MKSLDSRGSANTNLIASPYLSCSAYSHFGSELAQLVGGLSLFFADEYERLGSTRKSFGRLSVKMAFRLRECFRSRRAIGPSASPRAH